LILARPAELDRADEKVLGVVGHLFEGRRRHTKSGMARNSSEYQ
jgi:hypothetical protein